MTLEEIMIQLKKDPLWQPNEDDSDDIWELYDMAIEELSNSKKVAEKIMAKPDPNAIFDETFKNTDNFDDVF